MLGKLALQRTNWAALAVLAALAVALFAVMQPASAAPAISVEFDDSDGVVAAGTPVLVYVHDASTGDEENQLAGFTVAEVQVSGELAGTEQPNVAPTSTTILAKGAEKTTDNENFTIEIPKGTTPGEYTVTAITTTVNSVTLSKSAVLTVGDPGKGVDSVAITFRKSHILSSDANTRVCGAAPTDGTAVVENSERTDDANAPLNEPICLTATVKNEHGATANSGDVKLLFITAEGGTIAGNADGDIPATGGAVIDSSRKPVYHFSVTRGSAGVVTVEVDAGPAEGTEELTFTGAADTLSIGAASDVLAQSNDAYTAAVEDDTNTSDVDESADAVEGGIIFEVTAADKAGNTVDLAHTAVSDVKITDSNDKVVTASFNTDNAMPKPGSTTVVQVRVGSKPTKVPAGEYTAEVSLVEVTGSAVSSTFTVSGDAANVEVSADNANPGDGDEFVTVTATVTDADGNPVADNTPVRFAASGSDNVLFNTSSAASVNTTGGEAKAVFVVVGPGRSVVSAIAGGGRAAVVITSTAGAEPAEAMPEEEASVSCLSNLSGFSTWSCGVESSAAEIFGLVSGRGASAVHLWNGSEWVRYSVVEGNTVPGSSDFMVTEDDILYISN